MTLLEHEEALAKLATPGLDLSDGSDTLVAWFDYIEQSAVSVGRWLPTDVGLPAVPVRLLRQAVGAGFTRMRQENTRDSGESAALRETLDTKRAASASSEKPTQSITDSSTASASLGCEPGRSPANNWSRSTRPHKDSASGVAKSLASQDSQLVTREDSITSFLARRAESTGSRTWLCLAVPATALDPLADHIAAWSPDRVLKVISALRAAERVANCVEFDSGQFGEPLVPASRVSAADHARLREALASLENKP